MRVYVSEPASLDLRLLNSLLPEPRYKLLLGDPALSTNTEASCEAILIKSQTKIDATILKKFPELKHIIRAGSGVDNIDTTFCERRNIQIHTGAGANSNAVAEYTIMAILLALRKYNLITNKRLGDWDRSGLIGEDLATQTVGVVGYGHIGQKVVNKLIYLGVESVLVFDPYAPIITESPKATQAKNLRTLLMQSSVITLHVPLTSETHHLIGHNELKLLKPGAIVVNAARGGLVDEVALLHLINRQQIIYVADSVEGEPKVNQSLLDNPNVILTPHIAGYSQQANNNSLKKAISSFIQSIT